MIFEKFYWKFFFFPPLFLGFAQMYNTSKKFRRGGGGPQASSSQYTGYARANEILEGVQLLQNKVTQVYQEVQVLRDDAFDILVDHKRSIDDVMFQRA